MSQRPKRTVKPPKPIYVPDENTQFEDDLSVDSDVDEEELDQIIDACERMEEESDVDDYEYDDFVVRDDDIESEETKEEEEEEEELSGYSSEDDELLCSDYSGESGEENVIGEDSDDYDPEDEEIDMVQIIHR